MNKINTLDLDKLNKELLDGVEDYIDVSKSDNTRKAYEKDWKDFVRFCKYIQSKYLPADYPTVSKYLVYCAKIQKLKVSTIERRLASIIFKHRESLHSIDRKHKLIKNVIEGIKRNFGTLFFLQGVLVYVVLSARKECNVNFSENYSQVYRNGKITM